MSTRVIILAAGKGKRMGSNLPKPLVPIAGRPMIEHLFDSVMDSGIDERPICVVSPNGVDLFRPVLDDRCEYVIQDEQKGTGHAVLTAADAANDAETVIVLYADHPFLSSEMITSLKELHTEHGAMITMLTTTVPNFEKDYAGFKSWGRIIRDEMGRFVAIREAKDCSPEELEVKELNPALYAFNGDWLWQHLPMISTSNASGEYYLTDLIELAIDEGNEIVTASAAPFEVIGVNTPEELKRAEELLG